MVAAWERVTLYGLTIVPKRRVHYGPINRRRRAKSSSAARSWQASTRRGRRSSPQTAGSWRRSRRWRPSAAARRAVDEETLYRFYEPLIPPGIHNGPPSKRGGGTPRRDTAVLFNDPRVPHAPRATGITEEQFRTGAVDEAELKLAYRFEPAIRSMA